MSKTSTTRDDIAASEAPQCFGMVDDDRQLLELAHARLEHPSLAAHLTAVIGTPVEVGLRLLPAQWYRQLHRGVEVAIAKALDAAVTSMRWKCDLDSHNSFYKALCAGTGAVGGLFGLPALAIELPVTTTIMLRAIADVARSQGEDLQTPDARLACMEVFALGGRTEEDDAADTGYYGLRLALALPIANAKRFITQSGLHHEGAPTLVALVPAIGARFGVSVSEKAAAQLVPVIGAAAGASVNLVFLNHFKNMAWGHFVLRRLERCYGIEAIRAEYEALSSKERAGSRPLRRAG